LEKELIIIFHPEKVIYYRSGKRTDETENQTDAETLKGFNGVDQGNALMQKNQLYHKALKGRNKLYFMEKNE
jgi:hypothetical protein